MVDRHYFEEEHPRNFSLNSREKSNFTRADVVKIMLKLLADAIYLNRDLLAVNKGLHFLPMKLEIIDTPFSKTIH